MMMMMMMKEIAQTGSDVACTVVVEEVVVRVRAS
jgi:hypothetical protein